jgi:hypothetical protein
MVATVSGGETGNKKTDEPEAKAGGFVGSAPVDPQFFYPIIPEHLVENWSNRGFDYASSSKGATG